MESPALVVAQQLLRLGADARYIDGRIPEVNLTGADLNGHVQRAALTEAEISPAQAVVLLTDHDGIDYDLVAANASYVLDILTAAEEAWLSTFEVGGLAWHLAFA